jgi:UDP-N-acetylglucosamine 2-epimerase (non-hydrolysing)
MIKSVLFIFGTRPEAIKMAPLITELKKYPENFNVVVCSTGQHREMLDQVIEFFSIEIDFDLKLMRNNQSLFSITADGLTALEKIINEVDPTLVIVQGDTTSAFIGALAAYYKKIPIAHLEAGLRSGDKYSPFPEEMNRKLAGHLADLHFAPTIGAQNNLSKEGIISDVFVVGNTVIDALRLGLQILKTRGEERYAATFSFLTREKMMLVTGHRRESFGEPFRNICMAIQYLAKKYPDLDIVYPMHLNPNVRKPIDELLHGISNIHLMEPVDYPQMLWLMNKSHLVLTDSGGVQEEAPSLGKPVLVMRDVTERQEGIDAGTAKLVGTESDVIIREVEVLLNDEKIYATMSKAVNPYGDGTTSEKIRKILMR